MRSFRRDSHARAFSVNGLWTALSVVSAMLGLVQPVSAQKEPFSSQYSDLSKFTDAIERERPVRAIKLATTGITAPHHMLAADLMARAFWAAAGNVYERIIVLSPDHFRKSRHVMATTRRPFETLFGRVAVDSPAVEALLESRDLIEDSDLFESEHGVGALLPFVRHFFPDTPIVPIALSVGSEPEEWEAAAAVLAKIVTPQTLIVQSTDFSHYLSSQVAAVRDQETLNVLSEGEPSAIARLRQSQHLDSKASQYIQMRLQASVFGSHATIIANRNQVEYAPLSTSTTSYIVAVYTRDPSQASQLRYGDQTVFYFGGDFFPGRWLTIPLSRPEARSRLIDIVGKLTGGGPMIVNLEGVMMDEPPPGLNSDLHVFRTEIAAPMLEGFNVVAAGIANNHSFDLGANGITQTLLSLRKRGVRPLEHMKVTDMGLFRLVALNYIGIRAYAHYPVIREGDVEKLCKMAIRPPVIAFVHWGEEYTSEPGLAVIRDAEALHNCGVALIIGAHSHRAVSRPTAMWGGEFQSVFSLGNLLFDQRSPSASSAILELRVFKHGTMATRIIPVPNLFELASPRDN